MPLPLSTATRHRLLATLLLAGSAFCVSFPSAWQESLRGRVHSAAEPPLAVFAAGHNALASVLDRLGGLWRASAEVERLREENRALREALARQADDQRHVLAAEADLAAFERFRSAATARSIRVVAANVLAADASPWRHSLIIDRGSDHGLRVGTPAVWGNSIVGTVVALRPAAATVRLLTDSRFGLTVRVLRAGDPAQGEVGVLRGTSGHEGRLQLKWIHLHPVEEGDMVVTSGLDPMVPPGLVAGEVASTSATRQPLFYDVTVKPLQDLGRLTELLLILYDAEDAEELLKREEGVQK
jgi:rod shape-determining protein MreC